MELLVGAVFSRAANDLTANRSGRWTWPNGTEQSLADHLQHWPHYKNANGMSFTQMIQLHDDHHDLIGPISGTQLNAHR